MLLSCLLATLATLPQDPQHGPTIPERLDALIAKTDAYEHFVAIYHYHSKTGEEGDLRLRYREPDRAKLEVDGEKFRESRCLLDGLLEYRSSVEGETPRTASLRSQDWFEADLALLRELIQKQFPKKLHASELRLQGRLCFRLRGREDCESMALDLGLDGRALLGWLVEMRGHPQTTSPGGDHEEELLFKPCDEVCVHVSAETGFITRVVRDTKDGVLTSLSLISLDLEARPSQEELQAPAAEDGALDLSKSYQIQAIRQALEWSRTGLYMLVATMLQDGRLEWTEDVQERLGTVLRRMHEDDVRGLFEYFSAPQSGWIDEMAKWTRTMLEQIAAGDQDAREQLLAQVARSRSEFEERSAKEGAHLLKFEAPPWECEAHPALFQELVAIEKRILPEVYAEVITAPLLAAFDEKVGKQLEAK